MRRIDQMSAFFVALLLFPLGLIVGQEQKPAAAPTSQIGDSNPGSPGRSQSWTVPPFRRMQVVAFDKKGQAVTDLAASDLQVTDNGEPQTITSLSLNDNRPVTPPALGPHEYSNQTGAQRGTTIILFDLLNGTFTDREYVARAIQHSVEQAENPASVFLYILTNNGVLYPVRGLARPGAASPDGDWTKRAKALIHDAIQHVYGIRLADQQVEANREILTYRALHELSSTASTLPGLKSIIWSTQGFPLEVSLGYGVCHDLTVESVKIPCHHSRGDYIDFTPALWHLAGQMAAAGISLWPVDESPLSDRAAARQMEDAFSGMTGGKTYDCCGQAPAAAQRAFVAMRLNYTLTYRVPEKNWNGELHKVKVTCARKDVQIQAEDAYSATAPADRTTELVQRAGWSGSDISEIGLRAAATRGTAANAVRLEVRIGLPRLFLVPQTGGFTGELTLAFVGLTEKAPLQLTETENLTVNLSAADWQSSREIAQVKELVVPESVSQVRIIVVDRWANRMGSLTVPKSW